MKINRRQCITYAFCDRCVYRSPDPLRTEASFPPRRAACSCRSALLCRYGGLAQPHRRRRDGRAVARPRGLYERRRLYGHRRRRFAAGRYCERPLRLAIPMVIGAIFAAIIGFHHRHSGAASSRRLSRHRDACLRRDHQEHFHEPLYRPGHAAATTFPAGAQKIWRRAESSFSADRWASAACRRSPRSPAALSS